MRVILSENTAFVKGKSPRVVVEAHEHPYRLGVPPHAEAAATPPLEEGQEHVRRAT